LKVNDGSFYYLVEILRDGKFEPYARGIYIQKGRYLESKAFGSKFSIKFSDDSRFFYENAWFGYFKKSEK